MSKIHYFQRYSQRENVVTNNTLLLFSRLYNEHPARFESFVNALDSESGTLEIGLRFYQQEGNQQGGSVPDGCISQSSLKVLVETKLHNNNDKGQLLRHLAGFGEENAQLLLLINATEPSARFVQDVGRLVAEHNQSKSKSVVFCSTTFRDIINCFDSVLSEYDIELKDILEDYREFCVSEKLLSNQNTVMRAITAGGSFAENVNHSVYFDIASRGYSPHSYLGLYTRKSVRAIGKLSNIIEANYDLELKQFESAESRIGVEVQKIDLDKILAIMHAATAIRGWNVYTGHVFFVVEKFYETDFNKSTKFPIQRTKFFDLQLVLDQANTCAVDQLPPCEELAKILAEESWE